MTLGERYLARPDLFPGRISGEPIGEEVVALELAGIELAVEGLDGPHASAIRHRYDGWVLRQVPDTAIVTRAFRADDADFLPFGNAGEEITTETDCDGDARRLCGPFWMARLETKPRLRGAFFLPPAAGTLGESAIENYLRVLTAHAVLHEGGVILHSAAVVDRGEAYLFPAASGNGKSTLSRMSRDEGRTVLSDDMNALVRRGGRTCVAQLPFTGDSSRARVPGGPFPLAALHRLRKGAKTSVTTLGLTEALGLCFAQCPWVNSDPDRQAVLWDVLEALIGDVALRTLTFSLTEPLWPRLAAVESAHALA